ncbi:unnamed protein product [Trichogramma brassicae]|uniref:MARVEL domain-containing protein n=1 Tax=Trichogramma brassicae TaxID=86971 RepID=A0A6H5IEU9_9HYME|nr:unnamed protein product [Trichogramma brassicae]
MELRSILNLVLKGVKLVLGVIIVILYRTGSNGDFLGVGGTWNLNEEKSPDSEIVASGVIVGFLIYGFAILLAALLGGKDHEDSIVDAIMNIAGGILYLAVAGTCLHYWHGFIADRNLEDSTERVIGLTLGSLCVFQALFHLIDGALTCINVVEFY